MDPINEIAGLLGLAADKPEDIVSRVKALTAVETQMASISEAAGVTGDDMVTQICSRLTETKPEQPDPAKYVPVKALQEVQTQLASLQSQVMSGQVDAALERAREAGKLTPGLEEWATQLASKDLAKFEAWEKATPTTINLASRQLAGRTPPAKNPEKLDALERQMASALGVSEEAFLATRNTQTQEA